MLPSGVFYDHTTSILGNGVALNIPYMFNEIKNLVDGRRSYAEDTCIGQSTDTDALSYFI